MDHLCKEAFTWPTVLWTGMITLVGLTLLVLTIMDKPVKAKAKHGK